MANTFDALLQFMLSDNDDTNEDSLLHGTPLDLQSPTSMLGLALVDVGPALPVGIHPLHVSTATARPVGNNNEPSGSGPGEASIAT